jgi:hypothetical protein
MRKIAYAVLLRGFHFVTVEEIKENFAFNTHKECQEFLKEQNAMIVKDFCQEKKKTEFKLDCKTSLPLCSFPFPSLSLPTAPSEGHINQNNITHEKNGKNGLTNGNGNGNGNGKSVKSKLKRNFVMSAPSPSVTYATVTASSNGFTSKSHSEENNGNGHSSKRTVDLIPCVKSSEKKTDRNNRKDRGNISGVKSTVSSEKRKSTDSSNHDRRSGKKQRKVGLIFS